MVAAVTGFVFDDAFVKLASEDLSIRRSSCCAALIAAPVLVALLLATGRARGTFGAGERFLWLRTVGELGGDRPLSDRAGAPGDRQRHRDRPAHAARHDRRRRALPRRAGRRPPLDRDRHRLPCVLLIVRPGHGRASTPGRCWPSARSASSSCATSPRAPCRLSTHPLAVSTLSLLATDPARPCHAPIPEPGEPMTLPAVIYCSACRA